MIRSAPFQRRYCRSCRYPLYGIDSAECPECGRVFDAGSLKTTDPMPGFSAYRKRAVIAVVILSGAILSLILTDRYLLESAGTRWERCEVSGAIRSVTLSRLFGQELETSMEFRPRGFSLADARWTTGISAAITADAVGPGTILAMERDGAFGAFRFGGLSRMDDGQLIIIGAYAWRADPGSLRDLDGSVTYGTIGLDGQPSRMVTFGPFSVAWSESGETGVFFYYERFFGDARRGDTRMAVLRAEGDLRLERLEYEDIAGSLRATPTDGLLVDPEP